MQHHYFAASNSSEGFRNYYGEVFARADRLYVIKGGPGTGKSGLMKKCALAAERKGDEVELYYCSSDPSSLDGVLILRDGESVGILDGTAPHVWEPTHPGAREEILNLGQYWNAELLREQKNEILALANKKSTAYKRAYDYLRSCGNLRAVTDSLLWQAVDREKLYGAAERAVRALSLPDGECREIPALLRAIAMTGECRLDSFEKNAEQIVRIGETYGVGALFMDAVAECLRRKRVTIRISYDPVDPRHVDGIFLEEHKVAFLLTRRDENDEEAGEKQVNPKRFVRLEACGRCEASFGTPQGSIGIAWTARFTPLAK